MKIRTFTKLLVCAGLMAASTTFAGTVTWTGGSGTTALPTAGNWGGTAPSASNDGYFDGTVQTNVAFTWSGVNWDGTGGTSASFTVSNYPAAMTWKGDGVTSDTMCISNITIGPGCGSFSLGDGATVSGTVFRSNVGTNSFFNYSTNTATIAANVLFNANGGANKVIIFGGSGGWVINSPWSLAGAGLLAMRVDGTGVNSVTMTATAGTAGNTGTYIASGTLIVANGGALATTGSQTLTIDGVFGTRRLALVSNIVLNANMANINIGGRNDLTSSGGTNASIFNLGGDNSILGAVRFNASGGTNIWITSLANSLTLAGGITAANVTGNRYFYFDGAGTNIVSGAIVNGSATMNIAQAGSGLLVLGGANTYNGITYVSSGVLSLANNNAIAASTAQVDGGVLDINGGNVYSPNLGGSPFVGGLTGAGNVDNLSAGSPTLSVGSNNVSSTFLGSIKNTTGTVALQKVGTGIFTLAGASTYTGNTTVAAGTLLVSNTVGSATGSGNVDVLANASFGGSGIVSGNATWEPGASGTFTLTPTTGSGSNSTQMTVSGSLTVNGNNVTVNVAGGTPLVPGTYTLLNYGSSSTAFNTAAPTFTGAGVQLGTASSISTSGGKVTLTVIFTGTASIWTNNGSGNWSTGAAWSSNPYYPHLGGDSATLGVGSAYTTAILDSNVSLATLIFTNANSFNVADAGKTMTFANPFGGATVSVQAGSSNGISAAVVLNTNVSISTVSGTSLAFTNTVSASSGQTLTVSGPGTLALSGNNTYGPSAGSVGTTFGGGVLQLGNNKALGAGDLSMSASSTIQAATALTLSNNIIDTTGTTTLDNNGNNVALSGVISGAGAFSKSGSGTLTLNTASTYTGNTTIDAGTVVLNNAGGIPGGVGNGNVTLGASTLLNLHGNSVTLNGLNSSTNTATVDNLAGGSVNLTLGESGAGGTFLGTIANTTGTLTLVKDGTGTQTLGGTNAYTGGTTITAGILQVGNGQTNLTGSGMAVGLGSGAVTDNGALQFNLAGTNVFANDISGSGGVNLNNTGIYNLTGNNTFTGGITNNGAWLWINQATKLGTGPKTIQSALRPGQIHLDGSAGNLSFDSSITFLLSGDNGVLINNAGSNTIAGELQMTGGAGSPYLVVSNGFLNLAGQVSTVVNGSGPRTLTLGGAGNGMISGSFVDGAYGSSLTKADGGTWDLTGANSYTGSTTVNAGALIVDGSMSGGSSITVNSGTMLVSATGSRGSGAGTITVNGGSLQIDGSDSATGTIAVNTGSTLLVNGNQYGGGTVTVANSATFGGIGTLYGATTMQLGSRGTFTTSVSGATPLTIYNSVTLNNNALTVNVTGTPLTAGLYPLLNEGNVIYSISGAFTNTPVITGAGVASGTRYFVTTSSTAVTLVVVNSSVWTNNANGNWTTGANWDSNPNYPNAAGQIATLGVGTSFITVNLNSSETIGGVYFTNNNSFAIANAANTVTLDNGGNGAIVTVTGGSSNSIAAGISLNENTAVSTAAGTALLVPGAISGGGSLTVSGNGILTLSGANTYGGFTTLNGGALVLGNTSAIASGTLTIGGGSLDSSVPNLVNANNNAQNWNGSFTFLGSQNLNLGTGNVAIPNNINLYMTNTHKLTVGGVISGNGRLSITNLNAAGLATLELDGANSFAGISFNGSAILSIGSDTAVGTGTLDMLVAGCILQSATSASHTITNMIGMGGGELNITGTGNLNFTGGVFSYNGTKAYNITNPITTFGINLPNGAGGCIKNGPGTFVMTGSNVNTGGVTVNLGVLEVGSTNALGTGTLIMNGGALDSTVINLVNLNNNAQTWNTNFAFVGSQSLNLGTGAVTMNANTTVTVSNNTLTVGAVGGSGALTKTGPGTLDLSGVNTYTNNTTVSAGILEFDHPLLAATNASVSVSNSANLNLNFQVTNQVAALILNGVSKSAGTYNAANSGGLITGSGGLLVVPTGPSGPAHLTNSVSGSTLSLSWPSGQGWRLESQTNSLSTGLNPNPSAWGTVPGVSDGSATITINPANPTVFYRLINP